MTSMDEMVFTVKPDESVGYCASAIGRSIFTEGDTLDELMSNIREVLELYYESTGERVSRITLQFQPLPTSISFT